MNRCNTCAHWHPALGYPGFGVCNLIHEARLYHMHENDSRQRQPDKSQIYVWDYEEYRAGAYVGEGFGCIHHRDDKGGTAKISRMEMWSERKANAS